MIMKVKLFEYTRRWEKKTLRKRSMTSWQLLKCWTLNFLVHHLVNLLIQWLSYWYYTDNKMG